MKLVCIRHTRVAVPPGICYGQLDVPLASSYPEEARQTASRLHGISPDRVFSSPLLRCRRLAEDLFPDRTIELDNRLKELKFGSWEGKTWDEVYRSAPGKFWMDHYLTASCEAGESYPEFRERVTSFLESITLLDARHVVLVTHGGVIRLIKSFVDNQPLDEVFATFKPDFGGVYSFLFP